jgi:hypothetical protein
MYLYPLYTEVMEWLGHAIRMDETRRANRNFGGKVKGRIKVESLRFRWLENADNDIKALKGKRWMYEYKQTIKKN